MSKSNKYLLKKRKSLLMHLLKK